MPISLLKREGYKCSIIPNLSRNAFFCWYLCADIAQDLDANYMISLQQHERVYLLRSSVNISILQKQKEGV